MTTAAPLSDDQEVRDSWVPMIVIAMGQALMSFNVAAIPCLNERHGGEFRHPAHNGRNGDRAVFAGGIRVHHAGCKAGPAIWLEDVLPGGGGAISRRDDSDGGQPDSRGDARRSGLCWSRGGSAGPHTGRADCQSLPGSTAGGSSGLAGFGASHRRGAGVCHCRLCCNDQTGVWRLDF